MAIARMILWVFALLLTSTASSASNRLPTGAFSRSNLEKWEEKIFSKSTSYSLVPLQDTIVLKAVSQKSASGLFKKIKVDLGKYPYLNWSWRIENRLKTTDEKIKSGDDYAARVYVVVDGGILLWKTKAVNYVWANRAEKYEVWPNAFAGKSAMMMALRNRKDKTSTWYHEKRNVFDDLKKLFGQAVGLEKSPPNLKERIKMHPDGDFFWKIQEGRDEMPSFEEALTVEEIWDVINHIREEAN